MPGGTGRRWGFHQLTDQHASRLVREASIAPGDLVLDLGAGHGAITRHLAGAGADVIAFELDRNRAGVLRDRFPEESSRVRVVRADIGDLRLPRRPFRVVANPPYAVAVSVLRRLTAPGSRLVRADIVVPAHLAERWAAGRVGGSGRWQREFVVTTPRRLPRHAFVPAGPPARVLVVSRRGSDRPGERVVDLGARRGG